MQSRLTLRLDDRLIRQAKLFARRSGKSVSAIVADYFAALHTAARATPAPTSPRVRSLRGVLAGSSVDEKDYRSHLVQKYR